jgi:hypothetical protein
MTVAHGIVSDTTVVGPLGAAAGGLLGELPPGGIAA